MSAIISAEHLAKTFHVGGHSVAAVRDISLGVRAGELFGLFGHNGAGKSTLVRMLATLVRPTCGSARVNSFDLVADEKRVRGSIGLVAGDERSFYGRLSARDNLRFFAALQNVPRRRIDERVRYVLDLFDLGGIASRPFQTYSTGQKQRLNMARALLHDPPILFLDEPTRSMDVQTSDFVRALVKSELVTRQGKTVVFISHELYEMEDYCDRIAIVNRGTLRALGTPRELLRQLPAQPTYQLEVEGPAEAVMGALAGLVDLDNTSLVRDDGSATIEFTIRDGAGNWQASVWSAVLEAGGRIGAFRQVRGHTLRDVLRHFGSED